MPIQQEQALFRVRVKRVEWIQTFFNQKGNKPLSYFKDEFDKRSERVSKAMTILLVKIQ